MTRKGIQGVIKIEYFSKDLSEYKRKQLAQQIFHEAQEGYYQASMDFYQAVTSELRNTSDQAIDILVRQKQLYD